MPDCGLNTDFCFVNTCFHLGMIKFAMLKCSRQKHCKNTDKQTCLSICHLVLVFGIGYAQSRNVTHLCPARKNDIIFPPLSMLWAMLALGCYSTIRVVDVTYPLQGEMIINIAKAQSVLELRGQVRE